MFQTTISRQFVNWFQQNIEILSLCGAFNTWSNTGSTKKNCAWETWLVTHYLAILFGATNGNVRPYNTFTTHVPKHLHTLLLTAVTYFSSCGGLAEQAAPWAKNGIELVQRAGEGSPIGWIEEQRWGGAGMRSAGLWPWGLYWGEGRLGTTWGCLCQNVPYFMGDFGGISGSHRSCTCQSQQVWFRGEGEVGWGAVRRWKCCRRRRRSQGWRGLFWH